MYHNLMLHAHKMREAERVPELEELGNSHTRHETYHRLRKLKPEHFQHMKDACREHKGEPSHYHHYPQIVMFDKDDHKAISAFCDPDVGHHHAISALEQDNIVGGSFWKKIKRVAHKASRIYSGINGAAHSAAKFLQGLPIPEKARVLVDALEAGTALHSKLLGDGKVDQGPGPAVNAMV